MSGLSFLLAAPADTYDLEEDTSETDSGTWVHPDYIISAVFIHK